MKKLLQVFVGNLDIDSSAIELLNNGEEEETEIFISTPSFISNKQYISNTVSSVLEEDFDDDYAESRFKSQQHERIKRLAASKKITCCFDVFFNRPFQSLGVHGF